MSALAEALVAAQAELPTAIARDERADDFRTQRGRTVTGFESNSTRGWKMTFKNEWTVSVVYSPGAYGSNYDADFAGYRDKEWAADTAEVAAWDGNHEWLGDPIGWQTPNEVAAFIAMVAAKRKARKKVKA